MSVLNRIKGHFGKCFVMSFISSLKRNTEKGGNGEEGERKDAAKTVPFRLSEKWVETGVGGEGHIFTVPGIVSSKKPLVPGRGAGR